MCFLCRGRACGSSCNTSMQSLAPGIRPRCISIAFFKDSNSFTLEPYRVQTYEVFTPNIHEVGQVYPYPFTNPKINRESKFYGGWSSHPEGIPYWDGISIVENFPPWNLTARLHLQREPQSHEMGQPSIGLEPTPRQSSNWNQKDSRMEKKTGKSEPKRGP